MKMRPVFLRLVPEAVLALVFPASLAGEPAWPVPDSSGNLEVSFGASLRLSGPVGGNLRERFPISVKYN